MTIPDSYFPGDAPIENGEKGASEHKAWCVDVKQAIVFLQEIRVRELGEADGVYLYGATSSGILETRASTTPNMGVVVTAGAAIASRVPVVTDEWTSAAMDAPSTGLAAAGTLTRIDRAEVNKAGVVSILAGTESTSPSAPTASTDAVSLAEISHRIGETIINNSDDSTNGFITDDRSYVND